MLKIQHKSLILEAYFRTDRKINGNWVYYINDSYLEFPDVVIAYNDYYSAVIHSVPLFRETGGALRRNVGGRPRLRTEDDVKQCRDIVNNTPTTSLQTGLSHTTCRTI